VIPIVEASNLSKWYGQVIGINDITIGITPGITGLLGPNGAGKSTLLKLMVGILRPSKGEIKIMGDHVWNNIEISKIIGYCPDLDAFYENMTGYNFVLNMALLSGFAKDESETLTMQTIERVDMLEQKDKKIVSYSKGMRQRIKLAQAIIHDPKILFLDEPLSGMDPIGRHDTIKLIKELGLKGKSVIVSSHILHEIEAMTDNILLINNGRILAEGNVHEIRELIDTHPHNVYIICDKPRHLASILMEFDDISGVKINLDDKSLIIETLKPDEFYSRLPKILAENDISVENLQSPDDNLQAVFRYLVG